MDSENRSERERDGSAARSAVSFTFHRKAQPPKTNSVLGKEEKKDFVISLVGKQIESTIPESRKDKTSIIPLITKTKWRLPKVGGSDSEKKESQKSKEEVELEREAAEAILRDVHEAELRQQEGTRGDQVIPLLLQNQPPVADGKEGDVMADVELRPKESTIEDYDNMLLEDFGSAMLRGMGWKDGQSVGKSMQGPLEPLEYLPRHRGLGMGAIPKPAEPPKKNWIKKQGESSRKVQGPYVDRDGRIKHVKELGKKIPEQPLQGFVVGNYAKVLAGPHEDLYGKIVAVDEGSKRVNLRMTINNQVLEFREHYLELVSREEYRLGRPLEAGEGDQREEEEEEKKKKKKEYGLVLKGKRDRGNPEESTNEVKPSSKRYKHDRHDEDRAKDRTSSHHSKDCRNDNHHDSRKQEKTRNDDTRTKSMNSRDQQHVKTLVKKTLGRDDYWLSSNLRVKMVDRKYKRGRHYNTKMTVVDVVTLGECVCQASNGELLDGIGQEMVETVVPKEPLAVVKVVRGKRKNQLATIIEQDRSKAAAVIQLNNSKEVVNMDFDDICEFTGDIEDLNF